MGKGGKFAFNIVNGVLLKPFWDMVRQDAIYTRKQIEQRRNEMSLFYEAELDTMLKQPLYQTRIIEVHQPFDPIIHEDKLW